MEDASLEDFLGGSESEGGDVDSEAAGPEESGAEEDGGEMDGCEVDGGEMDGGEVDGGEMDGGEVDGGEMNGGDQRVASGTFAVTPAGASCVACGDEVQRRWRDERGLVCASCKSW